MKKLLYCLLIFFLFSCQSEQVKTTAEILRPNTSQDLSFPVYNSFDEIAPLFQQKNDTTYVINFWATWCKPCIDELPFFTKLAKNNQGKPLQIIMVSLDFEKDINGKLPQFIDDFPLPLPVVSLLDTPVKNWAEKLDTQWSGTIPVTVIYKNGLRFFVDDAFETYQDLQAQIDPLLQ